MQGTILILDPVATNRIMLKVQLSAAYYRVVQAGDMAAALATATRVRPDLIVSAMNLGAGDACALIRTLRADPALALVPVIALTAQNDRAARLRALAAGVDDVLAHPLDDLMLRARIRSLIRTRNIDEELRPRDGAGRAMGLAEAGAPFRTAGRVALLTGDALTGTRWRHRLAPVLPHALTALTTDTLSDLWRQEPGAASAPDAFVLALARGSDRMGLRILAELRARAATRHAAILAVPEPAEAALAADALDLGADDAMPGGFCAEELGLRLDRQLARKTRADRWRAGVRNGLRAALRDPMTGLYNRRHALPHLARTAQQAAAAGRSFAVLLADLDHFKRINDTLGHAAGDAVIVAAARRLQKALRPGDMLARVGGEEFMAVLPDTGPAEAQRIAEAMRRAIDSAPVEAPCLSAPVPVTISVGLTVHAGDTGEGDAARRLMHEADRALYAAKGAGRNTVSNLPGAA